MSNKALWCEHEVSRIMSEQEVVGVDFDLRKAKWLIHQITEEILLIDQKATPQLPPMLNTADAYKKPFLKSKKLAKWPSLYCKEHKIPEEWVGGPFSRVWYTPFDMGKTDKIKRFLVDQGWIPDEFNTKNLEKDSGDKSKVWQVSKAEAKTRIVEEYIRKNFKEEKSTHWKNMLQEEAGYKGPRNFNSLKTFLLSQRFLPTSPKLTETSFDTVRGTLGELVKQRVQLSHRRSLLQGLVNLVREDGRLPAGANPCATPTYRMRHRVVVNIPAGRSLYGKQLRGLFLGKTDPSVRRRLVSRPELVPEKAKEKPHTNILLLNKKGVWKPEGYLRKYIRDGRWDFVGYDASGLELRMLAHYMNDPEYIDQVLNGDIHSYNQAMAGLPTRDDAKTFIYAFIYGAGDAKLGAIVGGTRKDGTDLRNAFLSALPTLGTLIERTKKEAESGYLVGLDGRTLTMRKGYDGKPQVHKGLNTKLQGAGAIVMKWSMVFLDHWARQENLQAYKVIDMHDEGQWTSHPNHTPKLRHLMDNCCRVAGEYLDLNIPLASESMVGQSWYDTH